MSQELLFTIVYTIAFAILLITGEVLHKVMNIKTELTRKFAHTATSLLSLTFPLVYSSYHFVLGMGVIFLIVMIIAKRRKLLLSINGVTRQTYGGILLPVAITGAFTVSVVLNDAKLFIIPILILGVSDSLAGLAGMLFGKRVRKIIIYKMRLDKTYLGTSVFFLTALIISVYVMHWFVGNFSTETITAAILVAVGAALVEAFSSRGLDNFTVPLTTLLILSLF